MSWLSTVVLGASAIAAMRAALERGDLDEAARRGVNAGPWVVERALGSGDRTLTLAAIAAAPMVEDRAELLEALARVSGGGDRRTAIPAAAAARAIARELARTGRPDDLADDDLASWRASWAALALRGDRWIELRLAALDTAAALDPAGLGVDLAVALRDPDPAFRRAAATIVPLPAPPASYAALAAAVVSEVDPEVALGAAQSLCLSVDPVQQPVLDALGPAGLARIRALVTGDHVPDPTAARDAARCLAQGRTAGGAQPAGHRRSHAGAPRRR
ncbi:MAG TPA: hypothetical protein VFT22_19035 [Kofleriaceae bacterium]|nr:hypothetical protein [Kofleriaceae bacterium]